MTDPTQNLGVGIQYPKNSQLHAQGLIMQYLSNIWGLIDTLVLKDLRISQQDAEIEQLHKQIAALKPPQDAPATPPNDGMPALVTANAGAVGAAVVDQAA